MFTLLSMKPFEKLVPHISFKQKASSRNHAFGIHVNYKLIYNSVVYVFPAMFPTATQMLLYTNALKLTRLDHGAHIARWAKRDGHRRSWWVLTGWFVYRLYS